MLPLVLAFVALFSLSVVALLGWASTSFGLARGTRDLGARITTANSAVEYAIARLRANPNDAAVPSGECNPDGHPVVTYTPEPLNGLASVVRAVGLGGGGTCTTENGLLTTPANAVLAIGGAAGADGSFDVGGTTTGMLIKGRVNANDRLLASGLGVLTVRATDSNVPPSSLGTAGSKTPEVPPLGGLGNLCGPYVDADTEMCGAAQVQPDPRIVSPPEDPTNGSIPGTWNLPADFDPGTAGIQTPLGLTAKSTNGATCPPGTPATIKCFEPGRYTSAPVLDDPGALYWFEPGYYYFEFSGTWQIKDGVSLVAGKLVPGVEFPDDVPGACSSAGATAGTEWQHGAGFYFAGGSKLAIDGEGTRFEICAMPWTGDPTNSDTWHQRIALYAVYAGPPAGWNAHTGTDFLATGGSDGRADIYVHGTVYAPEADVSIDQHGGGALQIDRGIAARKVTLKSALPYLSGDPVVSVPPQLSDATTGRTVVVTARVGKIRVRAKVRFSGTQVPSILSWTLLGPTSE